MDEYNLENSTDNNIVTPEPTSTPDTEPVPTPTEPIIETTPDLVIDPIAPDPEPIATPEPSAPIIDPITSLTQCWALVRNSDGLVETFLRLDLPSGWKPPEGFSLVPDDQLPEGWQKIPPMPTPVPETVTATQIRLWLVSHGISMNSIYELISQIPDPLLKSQIEVQWEYAPYVERNHPMINTLGASLGLNSDQIDQAFREASSL
jgi:hypothetical protein